MIDQALIFNCGKPIAFMLSCAHSIGMPVKLDNHAMILAKAPFIPGLQNFI